MKLTEQEAAKAIKEAQLRCGNCANRRGIELINKILVVGCLAAPDVGGRVYGFVDFEKARKCPGSRRRSYNELVAHLTPPPDS